LREDVREQLADVVFDPKKDYQPYDVFGPLSEGNYIKLPDSVKVKMISTEDDVDLLDELFEEKYIGVDSEWRPSLTKFHNTAPALF
jgi:hypothetical protein